MPKYGELNKNSNIGDTVSYGGKYYKVINSIEDPGKKTIDLNRPIEIKIDNPVIDKFANTQNYKPLSTTKWDKTFPKVTGERAGTNLDKQNRSDLVKTELNASFDKNTRTAIFNSLDMFEAAMENNKLTKAELLQIFAPPSSRPPGSGVKGGVAAKFNLPGSRGSGIFDEDLYTDINKLRSAINKQGAEFFVARTNNNTSDENWQKLNDDYESGRITLNEFNKKLELARVSKDDSQNYLKQVLSRINNWKAKNENLAVVQRTLKQFKNFDYNLAMADLNSLNLQDAKNWRIKTKNKIIDDMFNNLKDKQEMKDEFGVPKFDKNGKLTGYSMEELYNQLSNSFDASGNYNPNHILETNYTQKFNEVKKHLEKKNKELYPEEFKKSGIPFLEKLYKMGADDEPFDNLTSDVAAELGLKFKAKGTKALNDNDDNYNPLTGENTYWNEKVRSAEDEGIPIWKMKDRNKTPFTAYTPKSLSEEIQHSFSKAIYNLYADKDDRNIINLPTPFFENYGPSGLGAKALVKEINLADHKGDSPYIWNSFLADWRRSQGGLSTKINGVERRISFMGAGESGYKSAEGDEKNIGDTNEKGIKLINNFEEWTKKHGTKDNAFTMEAYKYANDNRNNSAMTIVFPKSFLKTQLEDYEDGKGYLTDDEYDLIVKQGVTIIGKQGDFNNDLIRSTRSNLQAHVDYNGYYQYDHPSGLASLQITKDENNDYNMTYILRNPITKQQLTTTDYSTRFGDELDNATVDAMQTIQEFISNAQKFGVKTEPTEKENTSNQDNRGSLTGFGI